MRPHASLVARRNWLAAALLLCLGIVWVSKAAGGGETPGAHTEKVIGTPQFYQGDPRGRFPGNGENYCCPTAISDSLVYLAAHGFPKLLADGIADPVDAQIALIRKLAAPDCMHTNPATGTDAAEACAGIRHYVEASGYVCGKLEYQGWRPLPREMASYVTAPLPSLSWIKKAAADARGAVWVNIGWYVRGAGPDEFKRVGGHWVAVVGFGIDGGASEDSGVLLIDNPAVRSAAPAKPRRRRPDGTEVPTDDELAARIMATERVKQGRLFGRYTGLPRDAAGMYRVSGQGVHMSKKFDAAFLDDAIVLVIDDDGR
jgi:hypothetical protein